MISLKRLFVACFLCVVPVGASASRNPTLIFVEKATNSLRLVEARDGKFEDLRKFHTTVGKIRGDKEAEGDQRTPEGIYSFLNKRLPPGLQSKFGAMAFLMNYPNEYDALAGRSGSKIMLHSTNTPDRLNQNYDSEGCIVVNDSQIKELDQFIRVGLTPILVYDTIPEEALHPERQGKLHEFFQRWLATWEQKSLDAYIDLYHSDFKNRGMDKAKWKTYKSDLARRYASISVKAEDVLYLRHPKYSVVMFTQDYHSKFKDGRTAFQSRGTKLLYVAEEDGQSKVITEASSNLHW